MESPVRSRLAAGFCHNMHLEADRSHGVDSLTMYVLLGTAVELRIGIANNSGSNPSLSRVAKHLHFFVECLFLTRPVPLF